jgi:hypothetical protein
MSDANEERLLTDLLREVAGADAAAVAPEDLEQRTVSRWERSRSGDVRNAGTPAAVRVTLAFALAAAVLLLIGAPRRTLDPINTAPEQKMATSTAPEVSSIAQEPASMAAQPVTLSVKRSARRAASPKSVNVDFVPLVPMAADELSGSFQIVRVQMPRAALGALAGSVDVGRADDPVQADLLLGEDGMARAIRVSANGSVPWRSQ